MNNKYDQNNIVELKLIGYEVDIILQALTDYMYGINAKYDFRKKPLTGDESLEKYFAKNVYEHIFNDRNKARKQIKENKTLLKKIIDAIINEKYFKSRKEEKKGFFY